MFNQILRVAICFCSCCSQKETSSHASTDKLISVEHVMLALKLLVHISSSPSTISPATGEVRKDDLYAQLAPFVDSRENNDDNTVLCRRALFDSKVNTHPLTT